MEKSTLKLMFIELLKDDDDFRNTVFSLVSEMMVKFSDVKPDFSLEKIDISSSNFSPIEVVTDISSFDLSFSTDHVFNKLIETEYYNSFYKIFHKKLSKYNLNDKNYDSIFAKICSFFVYHDIPNIKDAICIYDDIIQIIIKGLKNEPPLSLNNNYYVTNVALNYVSVFFLTKN